MSPERWVSGALGSVETDGGAFNVLEGNHALNLAATYGLRPQLQRFLTLTGDYLDADLTLGLAPSSPDKKEWLALEGNYGNGLGLTLEHRQQYKLNALRIFDLGRHQLTLFNDSYYGVSHEGNLVPIGFGVQVNDTVDQRRPKPSTLPGASGPPEPACLLRPWLGAKRLVKRLWLWNGGTRRRHPHGLLHRRLALLALPLDQVTLARSSPE